MNTYDVGDVVRCRGSFEDENGVALDPTGVVLQVKDPGGDLTTYTYGTDPEVVREAEGVYHVDTVLDAEGVWGYRWVSSGIGQAAEEGEFFVRTSRF